MTARASDTETLTNRTLREKIGSSRKREEKLENKNKKKIFPFFFLSLLLLAAERNARRATYEKCGASNFLLQICSYLFIYFYYFFFKSRKLLRYSVTSVFFFLFSSIDARHPLAAPFLY